MTAASPQVKDGKKGQVTPVSPIRKLIDAMQIEADLDLQASAGAGKALMAQSLEEMIMAETLEDAVNVKMEKLKNGKDMVNVPMRVLDFMLLPSSDQFKNESVLPFHVRADVVDLTTGEELVIDVGADKIVYPLYRARFEGRLPLDCMIVENGRVLVLKLLPKQVVETVENPGF